MAGRSRPKCQGRVFVPPHLWSHQLPWLTSYTQLCVLASVGVGADLVMATVSVLFLQVQYCGPAQAWLLMWVVLLSCLVLVLFGFWFTCLALVLSCLGLILSNFWFGCLFFFFFCNSFVSSFSSLRLLSGNGKFGVALSIASCGFAVLQGNHFKMLACICIGVDLEASSLRPSRKPRSSYLYLLVNRLFWMFSPEQSVQGSHISHKSYKNFQELCSRTLRTFLSMNTG